MNKKSIILVVIMAVVLIAAVGATVYIARQQQDLRSHAAGVADAGAANPVATTAPTPTVAPTTAAPEGGAAATNTGIGGANAAAACQAAPGQVQNVRIKYPHCDGADCTADPTKADCTWDAVTGATSYSVKISQINENNTSTLIKQDTVTTGATYVFAVQANNTYECDVSAVNSCGAGQVGSITALCAAAISVPSASESATPIPPTSTLVPTIPGAQPTLPPTGNGLPVLLIALSSIMVSVVGGLLLLL